MNESKHKKKYKVAPSISYTPPIFKIWTKEQLFAMDCVASVYTKDIAGLSIPQLKDYIQNTCKSVKLNPQFVYSRHHIGNLVSHRAVNKEMKKVVMSSVPYVLNNGHPITKWAYKPNPQNPIDRMQSCLYGAPIMIDDVKYLCLLTIKFNNITGKIFPYVVNIEDENGMKVSDDISVLDNNDATTPSNSGTSTGTVTSQDSRAPSNPTANVQQNIETNKNNDIKTENKQYKTNRNMKHRVRLTESDLHRIVKESVKKVLNEIGDTERGQWMIGRLSYRQDNDSLRSRLDSNAAYQAYGSKQSDTCRQGYDDEAKYGPVKKHNWDVNNYNKMKFKYDAKKMADMDNLKKKFINFIEKFEGGRLLQTIVDYESGNQTGKPHESPLGELIPCFEENVLGYECTPEMKKAIEAAYNQWWFYAEALLIPDEEYDKEY